MRISMVVVMVVGLLSVGWLPRADDARAAWQPFVGVQVMECAPGYAGPIPPEGCMAAGPGIAFTAQASTGEAYEAVTDDDGAIRFEPFEPGSWVQLTQIGGPVEGLEILVDCVDQWDQPLETWTESAVPPSVSVQIPDDGSVTCFWLLVPPAGGTPLPESPRPALGVPGATWSARYGDGEELGGNGRPGDPRVVAFADGTFVAHLVNDVTVAIEVRWDPPVAYGAAESQRELLMPGQWLEIERFVPTIRRDASGQLMARRYCVRGLAAQLALADPRAAWDDSALVIFQFASPVEDQPGDMPPPVTAMTLLAAIDMGAYQAGTPCADVDWGDQQGS